MIKNITIDKVAFRISKECNAIARQGKKIIIFAGLILQQADFIEQKYTPEILEKYKVFQGIPHKNITTWIAAKK